jgi:hypothetical protein
LPQQACDSSQQSFPSLQQRWAVWQQAFSVSQHFLPCSQQPSFSPAAQQALGPWQQASFSLQQVLSLALGLVPQQALASSQQAFPSEQHFCTAAQQPRSDAQHFLPDSQQASLSGASQQALWFSLSQQASLRSQQLWSFLPASPTAAIKRPSGNTTVSTLMIIKNLRLHLME